MILTQLVTTILAFIFLLLSLIHFYWAWGGRWGIVNTIPEENGKLLFEPKPFATATVAILLLAAAGIVLGRAGLIVLPRVPENVYFWSTWILSLLFFLRAVGDFRCIGFFKTYKGTPFAVWDTRLYSPLCLLISFAALYLNISI